MQRQQGGDRTVLASPPIRPIIAIHGGAGTMSRAAITAEKTREYHDALRQALRAGQKVLEQGGTAIDAVTWAVVELENCPLFNAGYGAVFTSDGTHELDASMMDGATLRSGAIADVHRIKNPILAARAILEKSRHVFFVGAGAERFAQAHGLEMVDPSYFSTPARREQLLRVQKENPNAAVLDHDGQALVAEQQSPSLFAEQQSRSLFAEQQSRSAEPHPSQRGATDPNPLDSDSPDSDPLDSDKKLGTVGAVALDQQGNLAAATSTGGITNKQVGRVGDSPLIGAGCYANNETCAVSTTGTGEMYIRTVAAYDIAARMKYAGQTLSQASRAVMFELIPSIGGKGGLIAIDKAGNIEMPFNTEGMYRGYARLGQTPVIEIF